MMWNEVNRRIGQALGRIRLAFRIAIGGVDSNAKVQTIQAKGSGASHCEVMSYSSSMASPHAHYQARWGSCCHWVGYRHMVL
ncbi:Uncharacterised protein [Edwardsiella tarda]|nr:Uncharacterised protein [Edwardsiella tarda]